MICETFENIKILIEKKMLLSLVMGYDKNQ